MSTLDWRLTGWTPEYWRLQKTMEVGASPNAEVASIPMEVPGSVQKALLSAGIIPDWNMGLSHRECEWAENRHWILEARLPDELLDRGKKHVLRCDGLDYRGVVFINGSEAGIFANTFTPHTFDLTEYLAEANNTISIVFECAPRWQGQFGRTSIMTDWKARFNYTWDWTVRLVQTGIWDNISLEVTDGEYIESFSAYTDVDDNGGSVYCTGRVHAPVGHEVQISLCDGERVIVEKALPVESFAKDGAFFENLDVELWWPNGIGVQKLYKLTCRLIDGDKATADVSELTTGFKKVEWQMCEGAPEGSDPWLCVVNETPVFLQGVNWTPILPNFADVKPEDYHKRLSLYKDLGCNIMRVWGGAVLEREYFYKLCDEMGLFVWQEMPLSSSGGCSYPPDDAKSIVEMRDICHSYIERRKHHASLLVWSGGNELTQKDCGTPADFSHPLLAEFKAIADTIDPSHRFLATSPTGPVGFAQKENFGKGVHWHVHGPWKAEGTLEDWRAYWSSDDAMMRSETGAPGASPVDIIEKYKGDCESMPASYNNPYWSRGSTWWVEWHIFEKEQGREPVSLAEYVEWSQKRQADAISFAAKSCKKRFPACGGFIIWMGHDCFPCTANTAIVDFHGDAKPAALAVSEVFKKSPDLLD